jgi:ribosomal protein S18 acetylase RimI-like enzyme
MSSEAEDEVTIRIATMADADAVLSIDRIALTDGERRDAILADIQQGQLWLAELDGAPAGYIMAGRTFFGFTFIELLIVDPRYRRRGVAQALIAAVEAWSPTEKLFTSTNESNLPMQHLCERLGYTRSGRIDNLDDGDPEIIYFKRVTR